MANIKSQIKRNLTNEARRQRNQSVRSSLRTAIRHFREVETGDKDKAAELVHREQEARQGVASKGVIHANQAANKKSAIAWPSPSS